MNDQVIIGVIVLLLIIFRKQLFGVAPVAPVDTVAPIPTQRPIVNPPTAPVQSLPIAAPIVQPTPPPPTVGVPTSIDRRVYHFPPYGDYYDGGMQAPFGDGILYHIFYNDNGFLILNPDGTISTSQP